MRILRMMFKSLLIISLSINFSVCLSQTSNDCVIIDKLLDEYFNLEQLQYGGKYSVSDLGLIIKIHTTLNEDVNVSVSSFFYFDEVKRNCNSLFYYKNRWCFLQYDANDSMLFSCNLNKMGISNMKAMDSISKNNFANPDIGEYFIYHPFLTVFNIQKKGFKYFGQYEVFFPEINCPDQFKINRLYYPAGTKYYPRMDSLNKKFKKKIGKKNRIKFQLLMTDKQ